jgi:NAD(P)-dependent dehydrogenase (short-subunit alcohol dehydrogenase family)
VTRTAHSARTLPALRRSTHPRIVDISGGTGSLTCATGPQFPDRGSYAAYRSSKAALNALTVYFAHALADDVIG